MVVPTEGLRFTIHGSRRIAACWRSSKSFPAILSNTGFSFLRRLLGPTFRFVPDKSMRGHRIVRNSGAVFV